MQQQPRKLTFKERVQAFLDHLEIARLEIGVLHTGAECLRRNIDAFCAFVSNVVKPCCDGEPVDEITVRGRIAMKAEPDMARIASDKLFEVVELVERRLFTANVWRRSCTRWCSRPAAARMSWNSFQMVGCE